MDKRREALPGGPRLKWLQLTLGLLVLAALGFAAWKYLDAQAILSALRRFKAAYWLPVLILSALHLLFKALRFVALLRPLTDLPAGLIARAYCAGQPATLIPGGIAARAALLAQAGVEPGTSGGPILLSSLLDQITFVIATLLAALWYPGARHLAWVASAVVAGVTLLLAFRPVRGLVSRLLARIARRFGQEKQWVHFTAALEELRHPATLAVSLAWSIAAYLVPVYILQLCLRGVGAEVPFFTVMLAYTIPSMAGRLSVLPGGVGITEGGMIGMLSALAQVDPNTSAAAATLLRIVDSLFQGLLGLLVWLFFWRGRKEQQHGDARRQDSPRTASR